MQWIFTSDGVPPRFYEKVLTQEFGAEWQEWLPETLNQEISRVWGVSVTDEVSNKLGALKTFNSTDLFYHDAAAFENIVQAVNDAPMSPELMNLSSPSEIIYAFIVLGPIDASKLEREITAYIRVCCEHAGLVLYPKTIAFAQPKYHDKQTTALLPKISSKQVEAASDDIVGQQCNKLFAINQDVVDRIAKFIPKEQ